MGNEILSEEYESAAPFTWPIAHNVRPARQSLGINGCDDCHSLGSNFYFGDVSVVTSREVETSESLSMINFQGLNSFYESVFSMSFYFRPVLKIVLILSALIISLVVLSYVLNGIKSLTEYLGKANLNNDDSGS